MGRKGSNLQPAVYKTAALPITPLPNVAGVVGLEPTGRSFGGSTTPGAHSHWCQGTESNCRRQALQACALPLSYLGILVGEEGLEPPRTKASGSKPDVYTNSTTLPWCREKDSNLHAGLTSARSPVGWLTIHPPRHGAGGRSRTCIGETPKGV